VFGKGWPAGRDGEFAQRQGCIVTGAGRGIGRAIALRFARERGQLVIADRTEGDLESTAREITSFGFAVCAVPADVSDGSQVAGLFDAAMREFGRVDVLVNNAAIASPRLIVESTDAEWDEVMSVNLRGVFLCSRAGARLMIAGGRGGRIVNLSSINVRRAEPYYGAYIAAKGGVEALMMTLAAELTGKEAALLVSSGTMANLIGLYVLAGEGATLVSRNAHIYYWEEPAVRSVTKTQLVTFDDTPGPSAEAVVRAFGETKATLVALENSVARLCGKIVPLEVIQQISHEAHARGATVHLDGARLFNATTVLGIPPAQLLAPVDAATLCLTKGLGAPYGTILVGSAGFIESAKNVRWLLGGGLKQIGIMAAAGIVALETMVDRLAEDHRNAALLHELLSEIDGVQLPWGRPESNMLFFNLADERYDKHAVVKALAERNVLVRNSSSRSVIRAVTHKDVTQSDIHAAAKTLREVLESMSCKR